MFCIGPAARRTVKVVDALAIHICLLAAALGSPSFNTRESATAELHQAPPHVVALLADHADLEIRHRVAAALNTQRRRDVAAYLDSLERTPWIDALPEGWPERCGLMSCYLDLVPKDIPNAPPEWPRHREAMRRYCLAELTLAETKSLMLQIPSPYHWFSGGSWICWDVEKGRQRLD